MSVQYGDRIEMSQRERDRLKVLHVSGALGTDQNGALARSKARESDRACWLRKSKKNGEKSSKALESAT